MTLIPKRFGEWLGLPLEKTLAAYNQVKLIKDEGLRRATKRIFATHDVFYLLTQLCGRQDLIHPWIYKQAVMVQREPTGCLDLWAREHGKSSLITIGTNIQDILSDPEITIGIFSHTRGVSQSFLRVIMREFENNGELKELFDDVLWPHPRRQAPKWSEADGIIVKRQSNPPEATVEAWGLVDGMPTGRHFKKRTYDDVVVPESVSTPYQIQKTTEAFELSDNLGVQGGNLQVVGTRYHLYDSYSTMIERMTLKPRVYPATSDGSEDTRKSVFMTPEILEKKRQAQGPYTFATQMLLNPKADKVAGFRVEWLKYWPARLLDNLNLAVFVDPASGKHRNWKSKQRNDYTCMKVIGWGADDNYYIVDIVRDRLNLTSRTEMLFHLVETFNVQTVFYEDTGLMADIEHIEREQELRNYRFSIFPVIPSGKVSKPERILGLVPLFEQGRIYLPESIVKTDYEGKSINLVRAFIQEEYTAFPVLKHDDMLDTLAQITSPEVKKIWKKPKTEIVDKQSEYLRNVQRQRRLAVSWVAQ